MLDRRLKCTLCSAQLKLTAAIAPGKLVKCPKCGTTIRVPADPLPVAENVPPPIEKQPATPDSATDSPAPAAAQLLYASRSTASLFVGIGAFVIGSAVLTLAGDHDWYGRGPNVIVREANRREAFLVMFSTVLGAGVGLVVMGGLLPLGRRWAAYLGFPVAALATLIWLMALFACNADILWIIVSLIAATPVFLGLVSVIVCDRAARIEAEFRELRSSPDDEETGANDGATKLIRLLRHSKREIRLEALNELKGMGPAAVFAVPELTALLLKLTPPTPLPKGHCAVCGQTLSIWTRDRIKTPEHPDGFPVCLTCRNCLVNVATSEAQFAVNALAAIGPAAASAIPALRKNLASHDKALRTACKSAIDRIRGVATVEPKEPRTK